MKRQAGFTLIELVMVIVILGILSAFALPRFADLGSEARVASIRGIYGAIKSASSIAHAQALVENATGDITLDGTSIVMVGKYPSAAGIQVAAQLNSTDFKTVSTDAGPPVVLTIIASGVANDNDTNCTITYTEAVSPASPVIVLDSSNCN
jgi:MSHA pilin protein MshA